MVLKKLMPYLLLGSVFLLSSCATFRYAKDVKLVAFDEEVHHGKSIGPIRGENCTWNVLGYQFGFPTLDKAIIDVRKNHPNLQYVNHFSTEAGGFDVGFLAKYCIIVKGVGYK